MKIKRTLNLLLTKDTDTPLREVYRSGESRSWHIAESRTDEITTVRIWDNASGIVMTAPVKGFVPDDDRLVVKIRKDFVRTRFFENADKPFEQNPVCYTE